MRRAEAERQQYEDAKFAAQDSIAAKIEQWAGPKHSRKNLRAMLASFDMVLVPHPPPFPAISARDHVLSHYMPTFHITCIHNICIHVKRIATRACDVQMYFDLR